MAAEIQYLIARGIFATYGYFVVDPETRHAFLIDPGAQPEIFLEAIRENGLTVEKILLTHGHMDHMGAAGALRDELGVPVLAHELSDRYLLDPRLNLSSEYGQPITLTGTQKFHGGDVLRLDANPAVALKVEHVPGHTDDSCMFVYPDGDVAFVGDTVYQGGPGLTVFPTGNQAKLARSIKEKVVTLPGNTALCSGHAAPISVDDFRRGIGMSPARH